MKSQRARYPSNERPLVLTGVEDANEDLEEQHSQFMESMQSRLTKLQVTYVELIIFMDAVTID